MNLAPPMYWQWSGEAMVPRSGKAADQYFAIGEWYRLVEEPEHSDRSRGHQFAFLREAWKQLPEQYVEQFPSPLALRKRLLIDCGWFDQRIVETGSNVVAIRVAALAGGYDPYALISVSESTVIIRTARSQAKGAMNKEEFQKSKTDLLEAAALLIGVEAPELQRQAVSA